MSNKRVIIIGAGYGGMALANLLGKAGYSVDVYEKNQEPGGRITAVKQDKFLFDLGPSWFLMPEVFDQYYGLFDESVYSRLDLMRFQPGYKVFFEKYEPLTLMGDLDEDKHIFETIEPGAAKKLESFVDRSTKVYELSVKYFLYNNFQRFRDLVKWPIFKNAFNMLPLTTQKLDDYVGKHFDDIRLKQLLEYHSVFLGASPFQVPAIYTLMSYLDYKSGVYYPRQGMLSLVDDMRELGKKYNITYHYESPVQRILVEQGKAVGVELTNKQQHYADIVVSNADLAFTETSMLEEKYQSFPDKYWDKRQPGPGALLVSLGVKGELPQLMHHNLYFVDDWQGNFEDIYTNKKIPKDASLYVCNPNKTDPNLAPKNHENLTILMPIPSGVGLNKARLEQITNRLIATLSEKMDIPDLSARIVSKHTFGPDEFANKYNAWQYNAFGGESHLLSQSIIFRTKNKSRKVKNLYYVGSGTIPGIGLPMCLIGAEQTFKRITKNKSGGALTQEEIAQNHSS